MVVLFLIPAVEESMFRYLGSPAMVLVAITVLIGLGASWAAWRFRSPGRRIRKDALMTLGLMELAGLIFVATIYVASLFVMVGA